MSDTKELKKIKNIYGEKFKNLCREMFPIILEQEGALLTILEKIFSHNCNSLYETIKEQSLEIEFKNLIYSEFDLTREEAEQEEAEERTPYEILDEAGYNLYECETEEEIQCFRKFYAPNEVLCTIYNGGRLDTCDCFFAVRKDVGEIKRSDFTHPVKTDKYSLSVLGIQFTREENSKTEIISRYNHTVNNPNCTLGNDLDSLAPGLKQSFAKLLEERGLNLDLSQSKKSFALPGYTLANDGRYYKYNMEVNGTYYCPGNIVISNGEAKQVIAPEKGIVIDNFCLDLEKKEIRMIDSALQDSFVDNMKDIEKIETERKKDSKGRVVKIHLRGKEEPVIIEIDRDNQITRYENRHLQEVGDNFLRYNDSLTEINLPEVQRIGNYFLKFNNPLTEINLPKVQQIGNDFLHSNTELTEINFMELQQVGEYFLQENTEIIEINMPRLQQVGNDFLGHNIELKEISLPELQQVGGGFLEHNSQLRKIDLPKLQQAGDDFLWCNYELSEISLPNLWRVGDNFLWGNTDLTKISLPKLQQIGDYFLEQNTELDEIDLPELQQIGIGFLFRNTELRKINLPKVQQVGDDFLWCNIGLTEINFPELQQTGNNFLPSNTEISEISLPKIKKVGNYFLEQNTKLKEMNLPELQQVGFGILPNNITLASVNTPCLHEFENSFKIQTAKNKSGTSKITPIDIAELDTKRQITKSIIKKARGLIQKLKEKLFGKEGQER